MARVSDNVCHEPDDVLMDGTTSFTLIYDGKPLNKTPPLDAPVDRHVHQNITFAVQTFTECKRRRD